MEEIFVKKGKSYMIDTWGEDVKCPICGSIHMNHMKCRFCKKEYLIDWTDERPKPMFYEFYKKFMRNFKMTKIV